MSSNLLSRCVIYSLHIFDIVQEDADIKQEMTKQKNFIIVHLSGYIWIIIIESYQNVRLSQIKTHGLCSDLSRGKNKYAITKIHIKMFSSRFWATLLNFIKLSLSQLGWILYPWWGFVMIQKKLIWVHLTNFKNTLLKEFSNIFFINKYLKPCSLPLED